MPVTCLLNEVTSLKLGWVHTWGTFPASEQNSTGLIYQCCAHHQPCSPFLCQALGAVARPLCIIAKTTSHGTYFKSFLEVKLRKRNVFQMSQCSERKHSIMSDTHWSPKIAFPRAKFMCWHFSKNLQVSHNSWGMAMSKGERDCFSTTLFNRRLINLPDCSQGEDNLHSTCHPICALDSFLHTIFPWRAEVFSGSWSHTPRHTNTGTPLGDKASFVGLICIGILWCAHYNVNFPNRVKWHTQNQRRDLYLEIPVCPGVWISPNTSKCLGKLEKL